MGRWPALPGDWKEEEEEEEEEGVAAGPRDGEWKREYEEDADDDGVVTTDASVMGVSDGWMVDTEAAAGVNGCDDCRDSGSGWPRLISTSSATGTLTGPPMPPPRTPSTLPEADMAAVGTASDAHARPRRVVAGGGRSGIAWRASRASGGGARGSCLCRCSDKGGRRGGLVHGCRGNAAARPCS